MNRIKSICLSLIISFLPFLSILPQYLAPVQKTFTRQDTLRGSITPERAWWDLTYYHLDIAVNPGDSTIYGTNTVTYRVLNTCQPYADRSSGTTEAFQRLFRITKMLNFKREGNVYWIELAENQEQGKIYSVILTYGGRPKVSVRPPWSGGITWKKDKNGLPFVASACQGDGASLWWPCKDHMYDEPDSMLISVNVPGNLMDVSNGRLRSVVKQKNKTKTLQLVRCKSH